MTWTNIYTQRSDKQYMFVEKDYKMKIKQQKQIEEFLSVGKYSRTKTLGYGKECCDFHFYKK